MEMSRSRLREAVEKGLLGAPQAEALWSFLEAGDSHVPSFRFTHILYYLGGMIAIGAMTLFLTLGWEKFGGAGIGAISLAYAAFGVFLTEYLLRMRGLSLPAGITGAFAVALVPLSVYGFQSAMGWWGDGRPYREYHTHIDWRWLAMESATLAAGMAMVRRYRLPFLILPVACTLWYMSMDLAPLLFGEDPRWEMRKWVSLVFGLLMLVLAFGVDIRSRPGKDYAFWLYLFGALAFWGGLSSLQSDSEWNKLLYLGVNLGMIAMGAALSRRVFAVFGGLGTAGYLGHLAYEVFEDSMLFPFALSAIGFGVVYLGILWQRHERRFSQSLRAWLPSSLRELIETAENWPTLR